MKRPPFRYVIILMAFLLTGGVSGVFAQKSRKRADDKLGRQKDLSQAEYYFTEGMKYYILDSYTKAIDYFQKSLEIEPDNAGANYGMAQVYAKMKRNDQAIPFAEKALKLDNSNKYYYNMVAGLYEKNKQYAQAVKIYQDLIKMMPDEPDAYFDLAATYLYQEKYDEAVKTYDRVEKIIGLNEEVSRQKQQIYLRMNKVDAAIAEGKKLVDSNPNDPRYLVQLAEIYHSNKRTEEALPLLEKAVANGSGNAQIRLMLSDLYRSKGQTQRADSELEQAFSNADLSAEVKVKILADYVKALKDETSRKNALKLSEMIIKAHPGEAKAYAVHGDLLAMANQKENARSAYLKASQLDNSIFEVWQQLVQIEAEMQQVDSLTKHAEQALELFPNQSIFWFFSGYAQLLKKDYMKAVESLEEGRKFAAGNQELINNYNAMLGEAYNGTGEYAKSDAAFQTVLEKEPENASVLNNYSYFLALRGEKLELAKQLSGKLVEKYPDNTTYLDTHAWVLYMLKDYQQARKYLEKVAPSSNNGTILEHFGDILYKLGETEKALEAWQKAKRYGEVSEHLDKKIAQKKLYE